MGGHAEGLSSKGLSSKVVPVKTPHSSCHQGFQIKSDDLFYVMNGQIKNVNFTMLIPHLDKEGIWQARILSVLIIMMLWITVFLAEVWKCESKLSASGTQTCAKQGESNTWAFRATGKETGRTGRQSTALLSLLSFLFILSWPGLEAAPGTMEHL